MVAYFFAPQVIFLSTLSLRRATVTFQHSAGLAGISIHALLAESDGKTYGALKHVHISIHALLAESDVVMEATKVENQYFYPRSPCGERLCCMGARTGRAPISIHALLAESDIGAITYVVMTPDFYPRSPCGERRPTMQRALGVFSISIHALLAESDGRRPGGPFRLMLFLSTLSLRRATCRSRKTGRPLLFLSTLSLRRATVRRLPWQISIKYFYPRSPCGERLQPFGVIPLDASISIHALLAESDLIYCHCKHLLLKISIHALLAESDRSRDPAFRYSSTFLSTLSLRRATVCVRRR